jgi:hypothetical protein
MMHPSDNRKEVLNICLINPFANMLARQFDLGRRESDLNTCYKARL